MKRALKSILFITGIFLFPYYIFSQTGVDPFTYTTLKSGFGIRALSMGSAYTALGEEAAGLTYNPAGLGTPGAILSWETLDTNNSNFQLDSAQSAYFSPFAISLWRTQNLAGERLDVNSYGFGRRGSGRVDWGVTYKRVARTGSLTERGESADLGLILRVSEHFSMGAVGKDIYKKNISIPTTFVTGIAYFNHDRSLILTADLVQNRFDPLNPVVYAHYGAEWYVAQGFALRMGAYEQTLSAGIGLIFPLLELDLGLLSDKGNNDATTQYLFGIKLGKGVQTYEHRRK